MSGISRQSRRRRRSLTTVLAAACAACFALTPSARAAAQDAFDVDRFDGAFAQVRAFAASDGDTLWPGYGAAPFGLLLLLPENEILLCQGEAPAGFTPQPRTASGCDRSVRPRSDLPDDLLAAFPLLGPRETIVMGTPVRTGRTPSEWLMTILHEHFHQWQTADPRYDARVAALGLASADGTGSWMLDFPFPYDNPAVETSYDKASRLLAQATESVQAADFPSRLRAYLAARQAFAAAAGERNWRYVEFQLWQEGVARWTEDTLGRRYPDPAVQAAALAAEKRAHASLLAPDLKTQHRLFVYAYGAAEAMLIERCDPAWRARYAERLALGPLLAAAARKCGVS